MVFLALKESAEFPGCKIWKAISLRSYFFALRLYLNLILEYFWLRDF